MTREDEHYPRCTRCGLRTYVSNRQRGNPRVDEVTMSPACPAWNLPDDQRPAYPWGESFHTV